MLIELFCFYRAYYHAPLLLTPGIASARLIFSGGYLQLPFEATMRNAFLVFLLVVCGGCDLLGSGPNHDPITFSGTVVFDETGAPLPGIGTAIIFISPPGIVSTLATTRTDAAGRFLVSYDPPEQTGAVTRGGYSFEINTNPYDSRYTVARDNNARPGTTRDLGTVVLSRNPRVP